MQRSRTMLVRLQTIIGPLCLETESGKLTRIYLPTEVREAPPPSPNSPEESYFAQINEYLLGKRCHFDIPVMLPAKATPTQLLILQRLATIPYGNTATYGSLGTARVVGHVCATNPLPLIIPCHRVVPVRNGPGQYRGGAELKRFLLQIEAAHN